MENVYGNHYYRLLTFKEELENQISRMEQTLEAFYDTNIIDHVMGRLKSDESVLEKCSKKSIDPTPDNIVAAIHDVVGIRIICTFVDDTYKVRDAIRDFSGIKVIEEKDYISNAKPNGYRSYHMIVQNKEGYYAEIQIRTISMDTWAALEHDIKYKKDINVNKELITAELKRCADELASTDISMQTIRNMIYGQM
ncbi:MAG: GTP pyrophosphokinase family protein [Clostridiales bacterium]|nr:GTP pyrophosphokinase family protein [Clostridiales bacterium]